MTDYLLGIPVCSDSHSVVLAGVTERIQNSKTGGSVSITNTESM